MKTFLHYTKEQELDESFATRFPRLASAAQSTANYVKKGIEKTSSGLEKAGDVVGGVRSSPFIGLLKKGAGGAAIGQALSDFSEKRKSTRQRCLLIKSREYKRLVKLRDEAVTKGDVDDEEYYNDEIEDLKIEYKKLKCPGNL